jgi:hypothetical protein
MTTKAEAIAARVAMARELIEAGLPDSVVARRLQSRHSVSRTTAYTDVRTAADAIAADPDGPAEREHADTAGMIAALLYDAQVCQEAGDYDGMAKLIRSADMLRRWGGMAATL